MGGAGVGFLFFFFLFFLLPFSLVYPFLVPDALFFFFVFVSLPLRGGDFEAQKPREKQKKTCVQG